MGDSTEVGWTRGDDGRRGATWNMIDGCRHRSAGCRSCYAEELAGRFSGTTPRYARVIHITKNGSKWNRKVFLAPEKLDQPLHWKRPRRIFVNSMSDTFDDQVPDWFLDCMFAVMVLASHHTYQVLTKCAERMVRYLTSPCITPDGEIDRREAIARAARRIDAQRKGREEEPLGPGESAAENWCPTWPLPHVHIGFSAESQKKFDARWTHLEQVAKRGWLVWCSAEPLLGPLDISKALTGLRWLVVGGESGRSLKRIRPMHPDWPRRLQAQCENANIRFFFKQWGSYLPARIVGHLGFDSQGDPIGGNYAFADRTDEPHFGTRIPHSATPVKIDREHRAFPIGKRAAGNYLDGRKWEEFPTEMT